MEAPGIEPGLLTCKVKVLPTRLYPLRISKYDLNVHGFFTSLLPTLVLLRKGKGPL